MQHHGTSVEGGVQLESVIAVAKVFRTVARSIVFNAPVTDGRFVIAIPAEEECLLSALVESVGIETIVPVVVGRLDPELMEELDEELLEEDDDDPPELGAEDAEAGV